MLVIGLTGGIGSGKSTVASLFQALGVPEIDVDRIAHQLSQANSDAIQEIGAVFGPEYLLPDGSLNRPRMRDKIFQTPSAKAALEAIFHPKILQQARLELARLTGEQHAYCMLSVPLLFEQGNFRQLVQRSLVVDCPESLQISRAMARSQLSQAMIEAIMASQLTRSKRLQLADDIIDNSDDLDRLQPQIAALHQKYLQYAANTGKFHL